MNTKTKNAPGGVGAPAEGIEPANQIVTTTTEGVLPVTIPECKSCTVPIDDGDTCTFCNLYTPPATCTGDVWCGCTCTDCTITFDHCQGPLVVDGLLTEADELAKVLPTLLTSRLASASQCFPMPDGARVYVSSDGPQINISVTERDPQTRQFVTREFVATITEVVA